jgi:hypothetical protein
MSGGEPLNIDSQTEQMVPSNPKLSSVDLELAAMDGS